MPINDREWEQIEVAIRSMHYVNVAEIGCAVSKDNVLVILNRWREEPKSEVEIKLSLNRRQTNDELLDNRR